MGREETATSEEVLPGKKKLSRQARYNKLEKEQILLFPVEPTVTNKQHCFWKELCKYIQIILVRVIIL